MSDYLLYVLVSDLNCTLKSIFYWVLMNYLFILKCSHLQSNFSLQFLYLESADSYWKLFGDWNTQHYCIVINN